MKPQTEKQELEFKEYKCDLCWKTFDFHGDEKVPNWCPDCTIGVLRETEVAA